MLQTIDRALTMYEQMSHDDHNTLLEAELSATTKLKQECDTVLSNVKTMRKTLEDKLNFTVVCCDEIIRRHASIIDQSKRNIFTSAMLYLIINNTELEEREDKYNTIRSNTSIPVLLKIHPLKTPSTVIQVIDLVQTETDQSISTDQRPKSRSCNIS